jgi:hypothetical protein
MSMEVIAQSADKKLKITAINNSNITHCILHIRERGARVRAAQVVSGKLSTQNE